MKKNIEEVKTLQFDKMSPMENFTIGYNEDGFVLAFNKTGKGLYEATFSIDPDQLQGIVATMFEAGVRFQEDTNIDIGFGMEEDCDE